METVEVPSRLDTSTRVRGDEVAVRVEEQRKVPQGERFKWGEGYVEGLVQLGTSFRKTAGGIIYKKSKPDFDVEHSIRISKEVCVT